MGIIKTSKLIFDYIRRDEEENIEEVNRAIDDVSIEIKEGQFVAVLGHNGSGKSTFAKQLDAILLPTDGTVWIQGLDTSKEENLWEVRKKTGMTAYRMKSPNKLSGGQKQRVAIAGVMAMRPQCIVLDEPTAMLDPNGRREVVKTVHELNRQEGITVVLITHYMEEVINADRVIVMDDGRVVMDGTPREIFSRVEELKSYRLDVPQVTELAYELQKNGVELPDGILTLNELMKYLLPIFAERYPGRVTLGDGGSYGN